MLFFAALMVSAPCHRGREKVRAPANSKAVLAAVQVLVGLPMPDRF